MLQTPNTAQPRTRTLAVVSAGTSDPSTTSMLASRIADKAAALAKQNEVSLQIRFIDLRSLAQDITTALVSQHVSAALQEASDTLRDADALVVSTPVYKAGPSGLFTSFFQVLDNDLLIGTPVVLAATAGSSRHALVIDDQLRGLFAYLRTVTVPTSLFAAPEDWNSGDLGKRVERAATELLALISGGFRDAVRGEAWAGYQHSFGSAGGTEVGIDLESDLMRLATGGR
ncbi:CE1759 family FMN reductase [Leucobacter tenebrionis]|uniref:CE1759 family FMN reductase n=1 Tax=Leucobacter tenebrionis TaxID=2873270 RepID=UPI001CA668BE|nr:CE1759 family FMN reductase [Leucobacter tenebrionis]QZY51110.1 NAD(P)H-dependent oxidoreductase [Leucobacter tenebrionis]